jgi:hypothetical protein
MRTCPSSGHSRCSSSCRTRRCTPTCWAVPLRMIRPCAVSSNPSPDLELELRTPWWLIGFLACWVLAIGVNLWLVDGIPRAGLARSGSTVSGLILAAAILAGALQSIRFLAPGVTPAALTRVTWRADGSWRVCDGRGREWSAALSGGSRQWGCVTLLIWRCGSRRWWAFLTPATVGPEPYRRLRVRLRLHRHAHSDASLYNPPTFEPRHSQLRLVLTRTFPKGQGHRGCAGWLGHRSESPDGHRGQRPDASRARPAG